jgi:hypothetical protein
MKRKFVNGWVCVLALLLGTGLQVDSQTWSVTGNLGPQRAFHSPTVLNSGEVLIAVTSNRVLGRLCTRLDALLRAT